MFAVINHLHFDRPAEEFVLGLQEEGLPILQTQPGFQAFYFIKESEDRAVVLILWDTPEHAEGGAKAFGPTWFARNIAPYLVSEQQRTTGPVLVRPAP